MSEQKKTSDQADPLEPVPAGQDVYGRPTTMVRPESAQAADHWDDRLWQRSS